MSITVDLISYPPSFCFNHCSDLTRHGIHELVQKFQILGELFSVVFNLTPEFVLIPRGFILYNLRLLSFNFIHYHIIIIIIIITIIITITITITIIIITIIIIIIELPCDLVYSQVVTRLV